MDESVEFNKWGSLYKERVLTFFRQSPAPRFTRNSRVVVGGLSIHPLFDTLVYTKATSIPGQCICRFSRSLKHVFSERKQQIHCPRIEVDTNGFSHLIVLDFNTTSVDTINILILLKNGLLMISFNNSNGGRDFEFELCS